MHKPILAVLASAATLSVATAGQLSVANFTADGATFKAVLHANGGAPIANGAGFVNIGTFSLSQAEINIGNISAVLADFKMFGTTGEIAGEGAFATPGLYNVNSAGPLNAGDQFVGNPVFTVVTDSMTVGDASEVLVFQHTTSFAADAPLFTGTANLASDIDGTLLIGTGGLTADIPGVGAATPAVQLAAVPEPSAALLGALGVLALVVRRKR